MVARGRFITVEGIDGAGKSTHLEFIAAALRDAGKDVVVTREPGGTELGEVLRDLVLRRPMSPRTETLLMFAARAEHIERVIEPGLAAGRWVLCDRFTDATYAYQAGGRGLAASDIAALEAWVHPTLQPDLTLLFDVEPALAAQRLSDARQADRFEAEQRDFFARVRNMYRQRAHGAPDRFVVIDGGEPVAVVRAAVAHALQPWLST
jgi:dTMP kinase